MQIYVTRNGQQFGPYSEQEAMQYIGTGELSASDLAWCDGMPEWVPLSEIIFSIRQAVRPSPPQPVGLGARKTKSFPTALLTIGVVAVLVLGGGWFYFMPKSPKGATKEAPFINTLGMEFVPAGTPGVLFCRTETRVRDFRLFAKANATYASTREGMEGFTVESDGKGSWEWKLAGGHWEDPHFEQSGEHPVVCVSLEDAGAFCRWLTTEERGKGGIGPRDEYRLPTDDEWSAAVGTGKYPWGNAWPPPATAGNYAGPESKTGPLDVADWRVIEGFRDDFERTAPVGQFAENKFGLHDMGGNVWEWCSSEYRKEMNTAAIRKEFPFLEDEKYTDGTPYRVLRGGSWYGNNPSNLLSSYRYYYHPTYRHGNFGFRVVLGVGGGG